MHHNAELVRDERVVSGPASVAAVAKINRRAWRIVDRVLPRLGSAHGFYQPDAFVAGSKRLGERNALYRRLNSRLIDKAILGGSLALSGNAYCCRAGGIMSPFTNMLDRAEACEDAVDKLRAMNAAYGDMVASASKFDGSYEAARDRFRAAQAPANMIFVPDMGSVK